MRAGPSQLGHGSLRPSWPCRFKPRMDHPSRATYGSVRPNCDTKAREILDSIVSGDGLIFGRHDYRKFLKGAASKVLDSARSKKFSAYSFRHRAATELASSDMMGASYILGHRQPTTINRYAHPERAASKRALAGREKMYSGVVSLGSPETASSTEPKPTNSDTHEAPPTNQKTRFAAGFHRVGNLEEGFRDLCEEEDSNLHVC